jgi:radical SAM-linked protein
MRIRFTYHKNKPLRYTSTLDVQLIWERACRRASLPIAYTQGFHPQARIQQALPLPLGFTSMCEIADIWFETEVPLAGLVQGLQSLTTLGIEITNTEIIPENAPSLQKEIEKCEYLVFPLANIPEDFPSRMTSFLSLTTLPRVRNGKSYDIRPLVISLALETKPAPRIIMLLSASGGATARPEEVISSLGLEPYDFDYVRTKIFMKTQSAV